MTRSLLIGPRETTFIFSHVLALETVLFMDSLRKFKCADFLLLDYFFLGGGLYLRHGDLNSLISRVLIEEISEFDEEIFDLDVIILGIHVVAVEVDFHLILTDIVKEGSVPRGEVVEVLILLSILHVADEFVHAGLQNLLQTVLDGQTRKLHVIAVLLAHQIGHLSQVLPLDEEHQQRVHFLLIESTDGHLLPVCALLEDVDGGRLDDGEDGGVELDGLIFGDGDLLEAVPPADEAVKAVQLVHVPVPQPLLHLRQLRPDRTLVVSVHPLDLDVALVAQEADDVVHDVVVYALHHAAVGLGGHLGEALGDVVVVDAVFHEGIRNEDLFYSLSLVLFGSDVLDPSGLP